MRETAALGGDVEAHEWVVHRAGAADDAVAQPWRGEIGVAQVEADASPDFSNVFEVNPAVAAQNASLFSWISGIGSASICSASGRFTPASASYDFFQSSPIGFVDSLGSQRSSC